MKLKGGYKIGVQSIGRHNLANYQGVGSAYTQAANQVASGFEAISQVMDEKAKARFERQKETNSIELMELDAQLKEQAASRDNYAFSELKPDVQKMLGKRRPTDTVSTHEIAPYIWRDEMQKRADLLAEGYNRKDSDVDDWKEKVRAKINERYSTLEIESTKAFKDEIQLDRATDFDRAIDESNPEKARILANSMDITSEARQLFLDKADIKEEMVGYDDSYFARDLDGLLNNARKLRDPKYYEKGGKLDASARESELLRAEGLIKKINDDAGEAELIDVSLWKDKSSIMGTNLTAGLASDLSVYDQHYDEGVILYNQGKIKLADLAKLERMKNDARVILKLRYISPTERNLLSDNITARTQGGMNVYEADLARTVESTNKKMTALDQKDPVLSGKTNDYLDGSNQIFLDPNDPDFFNNLGVRIPWAKKNSIYAKAPKRFLDDQEAKQMAAYVGDLGPREQMEFFANSAEVLQLTGTGVEDAMTFFGELGVGGAGVIAVAGLNFLEHGADDNGEAAMNILRGKQLMDANPDYMKMLEEGDADVGKYSTEIFKDAYSYDTSLAPLQKALEEASAAYLIGKKVSVRNADSTKTFSVTRSEMKEAITAVTGGMIEHGSQIIPAPAARYRKTYNIQGEWDGWIDNLTEADIPDYVAGSFELPASEVIKRVQSGDYKLHWIGEDKYRIDPTDPFTQIVNTAGQSIVIRFGQNTTTEPSFMGNFFADKQRPKKEEEPEVKRTMK